MTTALDHINRAIQFIERHDGWVLHPGQDLHGWLLQARDSLKVARRPPATRSTVQHAEGVAWRDVDAWLARCAAAGQPITCDAAGLTRIKDVAQAALDKWEPGMWEAVAGDPGDYRRPVLLVRPRECICEQEEWNPTCPHFNA